MRTIAIAALLGYVSAADLGGYVKDILDKGNQLRGKVPNQNKKRGKPFPVSHIIQTACGSGDTIDLTLLQGCLSGAYVTGDKNFVALSNELESSWSLYDTNGDGVMDVEEMNKFDNKKALKNFRYMNTTPVEQRHKYKFENSNSVKENQAKRAAGWEKTADKRTPEQIEKDLAKIAKRKENNKDIVPTQKDLAAMKENQQNKYSDDNKEARATMRETVRAEKAHQRNIFAFHHWTKENAPDSLLSNRRAIKAGDLSALNAWLEEDPQRATDIIAEIFPNNVLVPTKRSKDSSGRRLAEKEEKPEKKEHKKREKPQRPIRGRVPHDATKEVGKDHPDFRPQLRKEEKEKKEHEMHMAQRRAQHKLNSDSKHKAGDKRDKEGDHQRNKEEMAKMRAERAAKRAEEHAKKIDAHVEIIQNP